MRFTFQDLPFLADAQFSVDWVDGQIILITEEGRAFLRLDGEAYEEITAEFASYKPAIESGQYSVYGKEAGFERIGLDISGSLTRSPDVVLYKPGVGVGELEVGRAELVTESAGLDSSQESPPIADEFTQAQRLDTSPDGQPVKDEFTQLGRLDSSLDGQPVRDEFTQDPGLSNDTDHTFKSIEEPTQASQFSETETDHGRNVVDEFTQVGQVSEINKDMRSESAALQPSIKSDYESYGLDPRNDTSEHVGTLKKEDGSWHDEGRECAEQASSVKGDEESLHHKGAEFSEQDVGVAGKGASETVLGGEFSVESPSLVDSNLVETPDHVNLSSQIDVGRYDDSLVEQGTLLTAQIETGAQSSVNVDQPTTQLFEMGAGSIDPSTINSFEQAKHITSGRYEQNTNEFQSSFSLENGRIESGLDEFNQSKALVGSKHESALDEFDQSKTLVGYSHTPELDEFDQSQALVGYNHESVDLSVSSSSTNQGAKSFEQTSSQLKEQSEMNQGADSFGQAATQFRDHFETSQGAEEFEQMETQFKDQSETSHGVEHGSQNAHLPEVGRTSMNQVPGYRSTPHYLREAELILFYPEDEEEEEIPLLEFAQGDGVMTGSHTPVTEEYRRHPITISHRSTPWPRYPQFPFWYLPSLLNCSSSLPISMR